MFKRSWPSVIHFSLLAASVLLAACGAKEEANKNTSQPAQVAQPASVPANSTSSSTSTTAPAASALAIATADGDKPGTRVEVQELKRTGGDVLTLKFALINDSNETLGVGGSFAEGSRDVDYGSMSGVNLIDAANKKKYFVVRDSEGACSCSRSLSGIPAKSRANLWAKFPAPPDSVQKISVVIPHFTPMDDVPISR